MAKTKTETKTTLWTFIFYPESKTLQECKNYLVDELHLTIVISPLHDKDINPDGTPKKPHYHILISFSSKKTFEQVKEITDFLISPIPQTCNNKSGMIRYFIHIDNPEKAQYQKSEIQTFGNIDIEDYFKPSSTEKARIAKEILQFCNKNKIDSIADLNDYCMENNDDWFCFLFNNPFYVNMVLSRRHSAKREKLQDEREERRDRRNGILPPLEPVKVDEKEIENLALKALHQDTENIVSKRNAKKGGKEND